MIHSGPASQVISEPCKRHNRSTPSDVGRGVAIRQFEGIGA
jgi:hypothetical protein